MKRQILINVNGRSSLSIDAPCNGKTIKPSLTLLLKKACLMSFLQARNETCWRKNPESPVELHTIYWTQLNDLALHEFS